MSGASHGKTSQGLKIAMSALSRPSAEADRRLLPGGGRRPQASVGVSAEPAPLGAYPPPVLAAAVMAAEGASFVLVGSAALWLHGEPVSVGDADVVPEPGERNLRHLREALTQMALWPQAVPPLRRFPLVHAASIATSYGRIDCLLERGRVDWQRLRRSSAMLPVADAAVRVAAQADARALRRRFKG